MCKIQGWSLALDLYTNQTPCLCGIGTIWTAAGFLEKSTKFTDTSVSDVVHTQLIS